MLDDDFCFDVFAYKLVLRGECLEAPLGNFNTVTLALDTWLRILSTLVRVRGFDLWVWILALET